MGISADAGSGPELSIEWEAMETVAAVGTDKNMGYYLREQRERWRHGAVDASIASAAFLAQVQKVGVRRDDCEEVLEQLDHLCESYMAEHHEL